MNKSASKKTSTAGNKASPAPSANTPTVNTDERANARAHGSRLPEITAAKQQAFLDALRNCGIIALACAASDVSRSAVHKWRHNDVDFQAQFSDAIEDASDRIEEEAHRRAVDGWDEPVFGMAQELVELGGGKTKTVTVTKEVGVIHRYSDRLLERLLIGNRPEKYNRTRLEHTGKDGEPLMLDPTKLSDAQLHALAEIMRGMG